MNKSKNQKPLRAAIHKYRRMVKLFEDNIGQPIEYLHNGVYIIGIASFGIGIDACPLCQLFYYGDDKVLCAECCISDDTGAALCAKTPYYTYEKHVADSPKITSASVRATKAELDYLEDLYVRLYGRTAR
jgi:hypothetical protein